MAYFDPFLLGPLVSMLPLPGIPAKDGVKIEYHQIGGIAQSLRGRSTQDVWSTDRRYTFAWSWERGPEARRMAARARALSGASLRLLDPFGVNLLTVDASVCGAEERLAPDTTVASWATPSGGTTSLVSDFVFPAGTELADGAIDVGTRWVATAAGQTLYSCDAEWQRVPVLGRPVTFSAYAYGSGTVTPRIWPRTASGGYGSVVAGTPVVLAAGAWSRPFVTLPAGSTAPGALVELVASGAATVTTTGWQVEHALAPTPWQLGGNCPEVLVGKFGEGYRVLGRRALELELQEAS